MAKMKPAETPAPEPTVAPVKKPTQKEAVIAALAAGKESPPDGVKFVKDTFGIDLTKGNFSTIKSQVKKAAGAAPSGKKRGRPAASSNGSVRAEGISGGKTPNPADLARGVKLLVATFGADAVKSMAEVFAE